MSSVVILRRKGELNPMGMPFLGGSKRLRFAGFKIFGHANCIDLGISV